MLTATDKKELQTLRELGEALNYIGIISYEPSLVSYFCTPQNAFIFARLGVDGIHFCLLPDSNDSTLTTSKVCVVSPENSEHYVEVLADSITEFLSLVYSVKNAGALECISYMTKAEFEKYVNEIEVEEEESEALNLLLKKFNITLIEDPYEYVKNKQINFDKDKIEYTDEYYEVTSE